MNNVASSVERRASSAERFGEFAARSSVKRGTLPMFEGFETLYKITQQQDRALRICLCWIYGLAAAFISAVGVIFYLLLK